MTDRGLTIEIYSDVVCPWCYIGKRRLERALSQLKDAVRPQIAWRPFQLNPTMPKEGMDRTTYLEAKFGSLEAFRRSEEHVLAAGVEERIAFALEKIARTPNTLLAHCLIWYAEQQGRQDAVVESLFRGYFEEGADLGSQSVLVLLADRAGLNGGAVECFLRSNEGAAEVKVQESGGHKLGIRAVPYFVLNQAYGFSGAQPVERFVSAIETVRAQASMAAEGLQAGGE